MYLKCNNYIMETLSYFGESKVAPKNLCEYSKEKTKFQPILSVSIYFAFSIKFAFTTLSAECVYVTVFKEKRLGLASYPVRALRVDCEQMRSFRQLCNLLGER